MSDQRDAPSIWSRVVADERFRDALIEDPLRALAGAGQVTVSAEQVRQLEDMELEERRAFIRDLVQQAYLRGAQARFGPISGDGRIGGPDNPELR